VSKPPAKTTAASKTAVKKTAAPASAGSKASAKSAPVVPSAKPVHKTAAAAPVAAPHAPKGSIPPVAKSPPVTAPVPAPTVKPSSAKALASRAASAAAASPPVSPSASLASNRFTDRFGPARTAKKPEPEPMDLMKPAPKADPKTANAWKTKAGRDLTEPELMAMPEAEYMNEKQIDFFRSRLQAQKDDLLSNAGETTEHLREDTSIVPDPADRATIEEEHALELRTRDRERKLLKKIAQSLARLDSGEYGYCDETGEPIGLARLLARPTATLSLEAQQRRELKQKMFGD
jgi:DnaK suppressor protein